MIFHRPLIARLFPRATMVLSALLMVFVLGWSTAHAGSNSLKKCNGSPDGGHHIFEHGHTDLDNGFVLYESSSYLGAGLGSFVLTACWSGRELQMFSFAEGFEKLTEMGENDTVWKKDFDDRDRLKQSILDVAESEKAYSIEDLPVLFGLPENRYRISVNTEETCGCKVAYPTYVRGKKPFTRDFYK